MNDDDDPKAKFLDNITRALGKQQGVVVKRDGDKILAFKRRVRVHDEGLPAQMIEMIEQLADTPYDIAAVDAAARVYAAAVQAAGGAYGHALAAVWRAWPRDEGGE
jgi:hypothetical protein